MREPVDPFYEIVGRWLTWTTVCQTSMQLKTCLGREELAVNSVRIQEQ